MRAQNLKTAHMNTPLGIDQKDPLLTWNCEGGERQTAYRVTALFDGKEIWNSGKVLSSEMSAKYEGPAKSRERVTWSVELWDENDKSGEVSTSWFEYALLDKADWKAKWIDPETESFDSQKNQPASVLKKVFFLETTQNARIYATAHGIYTLYINGQQAKENILAPGTSEYWFRMPYQTWDVSSYLVEGENRLEVVLGDGWWRGSNGNTGTRNVFGTDLALLLQLEVNKEIRLITDESWEASQDGQIRFNDLQLGERVDARMTPQKMHGVKVKDYGYENLLCNNSVPIREKESFSAKLIRTPSGKTVLDFGQNMAGYVSFRLKARDGQTIRMTHGEYLDAGGEFSDSNLKTVGRKGAELHQVVEYTCKEGWNEYSPTMCIFGFQYVLVETDIGITGEEFTAHAVYSDLEQTAEFSCDHPLVSRFFHNALWSEKSNFVDIPTDCPQRERSGWTGDAGLFASTGLMMMDAFPVYAKWLCECRVDQYPDGRVFNMSPRRQPKPSFFDSLYDGSCAWGDASVIVPYTMYKLYGDKQILIDNYEFMKNWLGYCERKAKKSRIRNLFKKNPYKKYTVDTGIQWGEWLEAGVSTAESMKTIIFKGVPEIATAYFAYSSRMMSEIAEVLGRTEDAAHYRELYKNANAAYHNIELPDGRIHSDRQCRYVRPLQMELLTGKEAEQAAADLNDLVIRNDYHLNTGFLTTPHLCSVLAKHGYTETAYRLLLQEDTPGWLYQVKQGATTVWESWEGNTGDTGFASLNHYSKGAVVSWMIGGICGINVEKQKITIAPQPDPLMRHAKACFDAPCGRIESGWKYLEDGRIEYIVVIPSNTEAVFKAPGNTVISLRTGENRIVI